MRFNIKRSVHKLSSKANRNSLNALALTGSLLAFSLPSVAAQEIGSPIRVHTSAPAVSAYSSTDWPVQPAVSPMLGGASGHGSAVRFSSHEDFSVPTAASAQMLPKLDVSTVSVSPASQPAQLFKTASTSKILASVNSQDSAPAVSEVITGPVVTGPEVIVDGDYPVIQDPMFASDPQYYGGMPSEAASQFGGGPNIGYDPATLAGCARENCRLYYVTAEALYWKQEEDQSLSFVQGVPLRDFDFEWGGRLTLGEMLDCINGWEFVYTGPFKWTRGVNTPQPASANSTFSTVPPLVPAQSFLPSFFNADATVQTLQTRLSTYEINRRWFATDLFSTLIGLRFVDYNENFNYLSLSNANGLGQFSNKTQNFLVGGQIGANMYRPVTQRLSYGAWGKLGLFANFAKNKTFLANNGTQVYNSYPNGGRSDTDVAGVLQGGISLRYQILPRLMLSGGYEALYIPGVATVANQQTFPLTSTSPNRINQDDHVFFHGVNAGFEYSY